MGEKVTELISYCGDTYQKVELANNTFYHRIKMKGDIAFAPSTLNLSLAVTEVDLLTAERDKYRSALESLQREALLCNAHGIKLQFVQFVLSKTTDALEPES